MLPDPWSAAELATLASLADTFVPAFGPGDGERRANLAAAAIDRLDPGQAAQLRLVLRLLATRAATLVFAGRRAPFADLDRAARERYLLRWATSPLPVQRTAFQALKRLSCFLAYAGPGVDSAGAGPDPAGVGPDLAAAGVNPRWTAIDYHPTIEPLTAEPTPIVPMRFGPADPGLGLEIDADVVIVGSGAGGGVVAAELARVGRSVVVLEAGEFVPEAEMPTDELAAYDRLYLDHGLTATVDGAVAILAGSSVGGGTTINWMTSIPVQPTVRAEWVREHGLEGFDGSEFEDDLATIEAELQIQGPPTVPPKDKAILRGAAALGWEAAEVRRNGVGCGDCGSCSFGCRSGAKQGGLRVHLATAWRHGARIVPGAVVDRVVIEGGRARAVEASLADGRRLIVHARQVVIAAGALRTPGILARSGIGHPGVGRFLRLHPVAVVGAWFDEPVRMWSGTTQAARSMEFLEPRTRDGSGFVIESAPGHPGLIALAFPWESGAAFDRLMATVGNVAPFIAICRDRGWGRVEMTRSGRARIEYRVGPTEVETLRRGLVAMARLGRAAGSGEMVAVGTPAAWFHAGPPAGEASAGRPPSARAFAAFLDRLGRFDFGANRGLVFSAHQMGTARMGSRPRDHPCDERGRVRADGTGRIVGGLYVADTSLFPTAIGVNPMVTAMLLARRISRTVRAEG